MNILFLCLIIFAFAWLAIVSFVALCMVLVVTETKKELEAYILGKLKPAFALKIVKHGRYYN